MLTDTSPPPVAHGRPDARVRRLPIGWIAAAAYVATVVAIAVWVIRRDGDFTYPLDDSYIHLRLGQNLAGGTLGMNPGEFASASSSAIWPVFIAAAVRAVGPLVGVPLVLATLCGVATLVLLDRWARRRGHSPLERAGLMAAVIVVVPLTTLSLTGMEHVLQVGTTLLLVVVVLGRIDAEDRSWRADLAIGAAALCCAAVRLEAVFVLVPLAVVVVGQRRWRTLATLTFGAALPVAAVVAVDLGQGWPALPASVLVKSSIVSRARTPAVLLVYQTRLLVVMVLLLALAWFGRDLLRSRWPRHATWWTSVALGACVLQLAAGLVVQVYRYEAYLVALCLVAIAVDLHPLVLARARGELGPLPSVVQGAGVLLATLAFVLGLTIVPEVATASREIHLQQVQMARFAATACEGCTVVVNDIGAVGLFGDVQLVDSVGLATHEVVEAKLEGRYDTTRLAEIAEERGATMAMVYPQWSPGVPRDWEPVGSWTVHDPTVLGGDTVVVYSLDRSSTASLRAAFVDFEVPAEVEVRVLP